jgi:hypothetical protein
MIPKLQHATYLTNQQARLAFARVFIVWQKIARFVYISFDNLLQSFPFLDIVSHNKRLDPGFLSRLHLVRANKNIPSTSFM